MTLQHMIELIQLTHPRVGSTLLIKLINNAMVRFAKDSYCTGGNKSRFDLSGVTLDGSSSSSPVTLTGSDGLLLYAYKDDTIDTITILPASNVLFYEGFFQRNSVGGLVNVVSVSIKEDATVYFFDVYGNSLSEFPSDLVYLEAYYVKRPTTLANLSDACEFSDEYCEAVADWVTASLYPTRTDMPTLDRLQLEKHFKNRYNEQYNRALKFYRQNRSLITVSGVVDSPFN